MTGDGTSGTDLIVAADDDFELAATLFEPGESGKDPDDADPPGRGAQDAAAAPLPRTVLIAAATGVPRQFYRRFARWLARERGFTVLTWDWRGIGGSRPDSLRGFEATMRDWGEKDLTGAIRWAAERNPDHTLVGVGHSFGGQGIGLAPNRDRIQRLVTVAVQTGYYGHWPWHQRLFFMGLWHVAVPTLTPLFGYFPSHRIGLGEDLPAGVARQWARWCSRREYMGEYEGHGSFQAPVLGFAFSDDLYGPRSAIEWMHSKYGGPVEVRYLDPEEVGAESVGHMGFFREGRVPGLWDQAARFLAGG